MEFVAFVYWYFGFTALLIFVLLFGEAPAFQGTPVSFCRWVITESWVDAIEWVINKAFGERGLRALDKATECCCETSNPALQIAYLLLYLVGYGLYWQYIFKLLPNEFAAEYHLYTGTAAVCLTLTAFLVASMSDPGRITSADSQLYLSVYPCDDVIFPPKQCSTCRFMRPGRSKHCNVCGSCIARFDHHCGWINNCVGLLNMRTFLAFLLANLAVCVYGLLLTISVMAGELKRRGFFDVYIYDPQLHNKVPLYTRPAKFAEWVMVYYPIPVAIGMFLCVAALLMVSFFMYQGYLISEGRTTYETFKRSQLYKQRLAAAKPQQAAAAVGHGSRQQCREGAGSNESSTGGEGAGSDPVISGSGNVSSSSGSWFARLLGNKGQQQHPVEMHMPVNYYDKGFWMNWYEVLFPEKILQQQQLQLQQQEQQSGVASSSLVAAGGKNKQQ